MAFQFSLATVLRVRESVEKREERALQKIQFEIVRLLRGLEDLNAAIAHAHEEREQALLRSIPAGHLHTFQWEAQTALEKQKALHHQLRNLEQERDQQIQVYRAALRDREMLTDMLDKQRAAYDHEQARTQQKNLDDIFTARRHRS
jgi:flagellar export protein FliJ